MPDPTGLRRLDFPEPLGYQSGPMPPSPAFVYDALPGRVVFGVGAVEQLGEEVDRLGGRRVLAIAGKRAIDGLLARLGPRVAASFTDVQQHVPVEAAARAVAAAAEADADCLVAMGGGSATGMAKAVALERQAPIVAVPTTYAGSEVTPIYGLTGPEGKRTGRDLRVLPKVVVYDPALTTGLPPEVTGPSGMNALAHCVEATYAPGANPVTSLLAEEGARALARGLPVAVSDPADLAARTDALLGAWLAGAAMAAAGVGIHHQLCHLLGGAYRLPHAELHAVVLPHAVAFVAPAARPQLARLAGALGVEEVPGGVWDLGRRLGTPASLAELGLAEAELDRAATQAVARVVQAPRRAGVSELRALLGAAWQGRRPPPT
ncbi:MAG TPA: maleylacetate reductase [Actinomycetota bacterium]|jgi:alcohol dehydrogenase class IV|nr:maleylacetate reductase [Actinomycetota bacterium]